MKTHINEISYFVYLNSNLKCNYIEIKSLLNYFWCFGDHRPNTQHIMNFCLEKEKIFSIPNSFFISQALTKGHSFATWKSENTSLCLQTVLRNLIILTLFIWVHFRNFLE